MNELIEAGDPRTKVVGKRRMPKVADGLPGLLQRFDQLQLQMGRLWGGLPFPKGVQRFTSQQECETWKMNLMIRNSPARR